MGFFTSYRKTKISLLLLLSGLVILVLIFISLVLVDEPVVKNFDTISKLKRDTINHGWACGNNWIKKNDYGLYEMYVEGAPFERGYINGLLSQELVRKQEVYFVNQIDKIVPSSFYQFFLKLIVGWFNKDLDENIPDENKEEIYGVSRFASSDYDYIAPSYQRILNYHGAHDIGHTMQNMNLVACTSFGIWGEKSKDSSLIIGRNFDFYSGDDFAKDKIILFIKPDKGYKMMMVTWGGMTGVVSGMNEQGLTVTLNAAPSKMPSGTADPVSIIAREILQYAKNIDEAYAIASKHTSFVSELFLIGSANDHKAAIIEKTPETTVLFYSKSPSSIYCTNHFQSSALFNDSVNKQQMADNATVYRYNRLQELLTKQNTYNYNDVASVLRDQMGIKNDDIGMSNENAMNQLIAHHSIIFMPEKRLVWVSTNPFQLGAYLAYDLNEIFSEKYDAHNDVYAYEPSLTIAKDSFLNTSSYQNFLYYKKTAMSLKDAAFKNNLTKDQVFKFLQSNPEYFETYLLLARYYMERKDYTSALPLLTQAAGKVIPRKSDRDQVTELIMKCKEQ